MKLSDGIKGVLIKKLSNALTLRMSLVDFNGVFLFLDRCDVALKIIPYGIFENEDNPERLKKTEAGVIFARWLDKTTSNIDKDFNKGRKLKRIFKDMVSTHIDNLAFNMSANNIFEVSLTSLFVGYDKDSLPFNFTVTDEDNFNRNLSTLREYLACVFFIDMVSDALVVENMLSLFINSEIEFLIERVLALALIYQESWAE